jgi:hypothetical protein
MGSLVVVGEPSLLDQPEVEGGAKSARHPTSLPHLRSGQCRGSSRRADWTTGPTGVHHPCGNVDDPPPPRTVSSSWCAPATHCR